MLKADFLNELRRYFAANKCENDLTPERVAVLWDAYQHEPLPRWRAAMSIAIGDSGGRPSKARIERALEEAEREEERQRLNDGRSPVRGIHDAGPHSPVTPEFMAIQREVSAAINAGAKPPDIGALIDSLKHTDPGTDYRDWIEALNRSPRWLDMPRRAPDGGALVRSAR